MHKEAGGCGAELTGICEGSLVGHLDSLHHQLAFRQRPLYTNTESRQLRLSAPTVSKEQCRACNSCVGKNLTIKTCSTPQANQARPCNAMSVVAAFLADVCGRSHVGSCQCFVAMTGPSQSG